MAVNILWGAAEIARAARILDENGEPDVRKAYYLLEEGLLPGKKVGRQWVSDLSVIAQALDIDGIADDTTARRHRVLQVRAAKKAAKEAATA
jgi:hypothetical protein